MKSIEILVGISNSGKSTFAHQEWLKDPESTLIVNRDKIRELLFSYSEQSISEYYHRDDVYKLEKEVTKYENLLIKEGLNDDKRVIVDATHLALKYLKRFEFFNVPTTLKTFSIPLKDALERNSARNRSVDKNIIEKQWNRFNSLISVLEKEPLTFQTSKIELDAELPDCIIFDIDGTLAHMKDRSPYDWRRVDEDIVDRGVKNACRSAIDSDNYLVICTGRDAVCYNETQKWLEEHHIKYDSILMRPENDNRPDWIVKEEMWRVIAKNHNIVAIYDDREQVVQRARSLGLKVFQVEYNNF